MDPRPGMIVLYTLGSDDADWANARLRAGGGYEDPSGNRLISGNQARAGDVLPAMIVAVWNPPWANLQVFLDGNDTLWVTSRKEGSLTGEWQVREPVRCDTCAEPGETGAVPVPASMSELRRLRAELGLPPFETARP